MKWALGAGLVVWLALVIRYRWKAAGTEVDRRWEGNALLVWDER